MGETEVLNDFSEGLKVFLQVAQMVTILYAVYKFSRKPHDSLEQRVTNLEVKVNEIEDSLKQGNDKFRELKKASTLIVNSIIALIEFEVDYCMHHGDEKISDKLEQSKNALYNFLTEK